MKRCYCFVESHGRIVPCGNSQCNDTDFCKNHLILFNIKSKNIKVTDTRVSYVNPRSGATILDDTWFRKTDKFFKGWESKLIASQSSYTWIFVYFMVKRIEHKLETLRRNMYARRIQRVWRRCVSNPEYKVCRNRLMREYNEDNIKSIYERDRRRAGQE